MGNITSAARTMIEAGFSVIPCHATKKAAITWKPYQTRRMTESEIVEHFTSAERLAMVCGSISGNLECLDFDDPATFNPFLELVESQQPGLTAKLPKRQTPSGGYHLVYRCVNPTQGNLKLACNKDNNVRIETRGEGGYALAPPSSGYSIIEHSLLKCPTLTAEEVAILHSAAKTFDLREQANTASPLCNNSGNDRPGDQFNIENSIPELLLKYGWREDRKTSSGMGYTRPGKDQGTSGVLLEETGNFYCWSSNAHPLEPGKSYNAFALFSLYEHGGDYSAAARSISNVTDKKSRYLSVTDRDFRRCPETVGCDLVTDRTPPPSSNNKNDSMNETVERLSALSPLEYDLIRESESEKLGVRKSALDQAVKEARKNGGTDTDLLFKEVVPWPEQIHPAELLSDIMAAVRRFIVCDMQISIAVALWVAMTWFMDAVHVAPLAAITAPEKRCGKTQLLTLLGKLVYRPITASSISPAALFRAIDAWEPTLLIDEVDACMKDNEELRGIINSGHTRDSAYVIRTVGEDFTPTKFSTWGPKALSGIGHVADTLMDRAIILELRRKLSHENVDRLRYAETGFFGDLAAKLARFSMDYSEQVRQARPYLPPSLNDRAQDNWEPLLAIAMVAGPEWLELATQTALKISGTESAAQSIGVELLTDIQEIFEEKAVDRISTADLIKALIEDDEKPWATFNRGMQIRPRQLANRLKGYDITSKTVRFNSILTSKGFEKKQFEEAFSRYIPITPPLSVTRSQTNNGAVLQKSLSVTEKTRDVLSVTNAFEVTI